MKKLFISCPMRGMSKEEILSTRNYMKKVAEAVFGCELQVIDSFFSFVDDDFVVPDVKSKPIFMLGEAIKMMADADYYIGVEYPDKYRGCYIENEVAARYGLESFFIHGSLIYGPDIWYDMNRVEWTTVGSMMPMNPPEDEC